MGQKDKEPGRFELSRRDFLKVGVAGAAAAGALNFAPAPAMAEMPLHTVAGGFSGNDTTINRFHTTCPYCSASCGQIVAVGDKTGDVYDIYGDEMSPNNNGGLCAKGAGAYQLATNKRRLGAFAGTHPVNPKFAYDSAFDSTGVAYKRTGTAAWDSISLETAMDEIAAGMVTARGAVNAANGFNSKGVAFMGCSHMNNEQNYTYRKLIAQFGSSNVEHQARI
jgi:formate dehydrogenase major subunit